MPPTLITALLLISHLFHGQRKTTWEGKSAFVWVKTEHHAVQKCEPRTAALITLSNEVRAYGPWTRPNAGYVLIKEVASTVKHKKQKMRKKNQINDIPSVLKTLVPNIKKTVSQLRGITQRRRSKWKKRRIESKQRKVNKIIRHVFKHAPIPTVNHCNY